MVVVCYYGFDVNQLCGKYNNSQVIIIIILVIIFSFKKQQYLL